jgi:hypothetical protein
MRTCHTIESCIKHTYLRLNHASCIYSHAQVTNSIFKREVVSFSEIYEASTFKMDMTTASISVFDKTDESRWKMLGNASSGRATAVE